MNTDDYPTQDMGVVCRRNNSSYLVSTGKRILSCVASPQWKDSSPDPENPRARDRGTANPVKARRLPPTFVVGDRVQVQRTADDAGWIVGLFPRRNQISRRATGSSRRNPGEQILAANVDQVVAFCAVDHAPPEWHLLDRFLALAEAVGLPAVIVLSKADRLPRVGPALEEIQTEAAEYRRIGYPLIECSSKTGAGIEEATDLLRKRTSILLGKSGVGKSSLLNALFPGWNLRVGETNRFGEGRCTTSNAELFPLRDGGAVVDTPGLRTVALWGGENQNPAHFFREMQSLEGRCRFGLDCRHMEEPGCAVRRAVESGEIRVRRFRSMLHLAEERS
jgi:ribosome biogenesis GTPase